MPRPAARATDDLGHRSGTVADLMSATVPLALLEFRLPVHPGSGSPEGPVRTLPGRAASGKSSTTCAHPVRFPHVNSGWACGQ